MIYDLGKRIRKRDQKTNSTYYLESNHVLFGRRIFFFQFLGQNAKTFKWYVHLVNNTVQLLMFSIIMHRWFHPKLDSCYYFTQQIFGFFLQLHNMVKLNFNLIHRSHFYLRPFMTVTIGYPLKKIVFGFLIFITVFILAELSSRGAKQR